VGESFWEELDEVVAGENEGWPWREGFSSWQVCSGTPGPFDLPIDVYGHDEGVVIIAAGVYRQAFHSTAWPADYEGNVFYADFYAGFMRRLRNNAGNWERIDPTGQTSSTPWATGLNTPVDFQWGPDGHLWYLSQNAGHLRRIVGSSAIGVEPRVTPSRLALAAMPNPTSGHADLSFDLPAAGQIRIGVYDLAGRRVSVLADEWRDAGRHALKWNGRDAAGRRAPAGIYVVRLEASGSEVTIRVTRID
jgi:flagellar hook capping protein FlgD